MATKISLADIIRCADEKKEVVDLSDMDINDNDIPDIIDGLSTLSDKLESLNLSKNKIGDNGAQLLADFLAECSNLQEVDLQFNQISKEGMKSLFTKLGADITIALSNNLEHDEAVVNTLRRESLGLDLHFQNRY